MYFAGPITGRAAAVEGSDSMIQVQNCVNYPRRVLVSSAEAPHADACAREALAVSVSPKRRKVRALGAKLIRRRMHNSLPGMIQNCAQFAQVEVWDSNDQQVCGLQGKGAQVYSPFELRLPDRRG